MRGRGLRLDVHESGSELCVVADLPGVQPSDVDVRLDGMTLVISALGATRSVRDPTGAFETLRTVRIACNVATRERSSCGSVIFRSYF